MKKILGKSYQNGMRESGAGFSLFGFLIVVAIVAAAAGFYFVNYHKQINENRDKIIKTNLSHIVANGFGHFDIFGNYESFCATESVIALEDEIAKAHSTSKHNCAYLNFCACATLNTIPGDVFCVDSTGVRKESAATCELACHVDGVCL